MHYETAEHFKIRHPNKADFFSALIIASQEHVMQRLYNHDSSYNGT